jgi:hypothetical protein
MLAFRTRIGIQVVSTCQEHYFRRNVAVHLVLPSRHGGCDQKQNEPRNPHFIEHLEVENADAGVQLNPDKEVVHRRARQAVCPSTQDSLDIHNDTAKVAGKNRNSHNRSKLIDQSIQRKDPCDMQAERHGDSGVEAGVGGAVVRQSLPTFVVEFPSVAHDAGHVAVHEGLEDEEDPVDRPCFGGRVGSFVDELAEVLDETGP